jgi:hypothetical protein
VDGGPECWESRQSRTGPTDIILRKSFDIIPCAYNITAKSIPEGMIVAKPIEIGLVLEGKDAKAFQKYLEHPTFTREGLNLLREAKSDAEHARLD